MWDIPLYVAHQYDGIHQDIQRNCRKQYQLCQEYIRRRRVLHYAIPVCNCCFKVQSAII